MIDSDTLDLTQPYYEVCCWSDAILYRTNSLEAAKAFLAASQNAVSIWGPHHVSEPRKM